VTEWLSNPHRSSTYRAFITSTELNQAGRMHFSERKLGAAKCSRQLLKTMQKNPQVYLSYLMLRDSYHST
jgi:hypothetical protein